MTPQLCSVPSSLSTANGFAARGLLNCLPQVREQGKLVFFDLSGDGAKVQLMSDSKTFDGDEAAWAQIVYALRRGDIVGITGFPGKSKRGELSIFPTAISLLSPCMHMVSSPSSFSYFSLSPCSLVALGQGYCGALKAQTGGLGPALGRALAPLTAPPRN